MQILKRKQERHYSAHHMLIETAALANERALKQEPGCFNDTLAAMLFSALAVEALANAFGERKVKNWPDFENSSPNAKLQLVAMSLNIQYDPQAEPWLAARWLIKFRNRIAHAKPQLIREEMTITQEQFNNRLFDRPNSKIEAEITLENAARALEAVNQVKNILCASMSPEETMGLITDGWSGSMSVHP